MQELPFKFKFLDAAGNEQGWRSKVGKVTNTELHLDDQAIPIVVVQRAVRRFDRLLLSLFTEDGTPNMVAMAIKGGSIKRVAAAINQATSRRWIEARQKALQEEGSALTIRSEECPYCRSVMDLTDFEVSPQKFCVFCESVISPSNQRPQNEGDHALCDECGYFSRPREFSVFYFYFLLVVYCFRHGKKYICPGCMRSEAWKMLAANFIFILGVPFAIIQLIRAYTSDTGSSTGTFKGLDAANLAARKKRTKEALRRYGKIRENTTDHAGIRYNVGLTMAEAGNYEDAVKQFRSGLVLCSNHGPCFEAACNCYQHLGNQAELQALMKSWGIEEEAAGATAEPPVPSEPPRPPGLEY